MPDLVFVSAGLGFTDVHMKMNVLMHGAPSLTGRNNTSALGPGFT